MLPDARWSRNRIPFRTLPAGTRSDDMTGNNNEELRMQIVVELHFLVQQVAATRESFKIPGMTKDDVNWASHGIRRMKVLMWRACQLVKEMEDGI
jgi:hypothetical protein